MRTEDGYIVQRCLNGEPEAFGLLVDKYKASIYAFVYVKLRNFHDAEDVAQDVFIKAYEKLRNLRRYDSFLAWLYSIASDLCRKWVRSQASRPDRDFIEDQNPEIRENISTEPYREDTVYESLHEALNHLPEMYQQVLTLYYLGGMNSREIARFLGTSPTAIRQRISRARAQLKEEVLAMSDFSAAETTGQLYVPHRGGSPADKNPSHAAHGRASLGAFSGSRNHHCSLKPQPISELTR